MYVCMYVCMYVRMYVRTYVCMHLCARIELYASVQYVFTHADTKRPVFALFDMRCMRTQQSEQPNGNSVGERLEHISWQRRERAQPLHEVTIHAFHGR